MKVLWNDSCCFHIGLSHPTGANNILGYALFVRDVFLSFLSCCFLFRLCRRRCDPDTILGVLKFPEMNRIVLFDECQQRKIYNLRTPNHPHILYLRPGYTAYYWTGVSQRGHDPDVTAAKRFRTTSQGSETIIHRDIGKAYQISVAGSYSSMTIQAEP